MPYVILQFRPACKDEVPRQGLKAQYSSFL